MIFEVYWCGYEQFVLFINAEGDNYDTVVTEETVGNVTFTYPTSHRLEFYGAYNRDIGSRFNSLQWAFENGLLKYDDLITVKENLESGTKISID